MADIYDVGIIGSGPGGYVAAIRCSQLGKRCALIDFDKARLGGVCLNEGCIPTKTMIHITEQILNIRKSERFGILARCQTPDLKRVAAYSRGVRDLLRKGIQHLLDKNGVDFLEGKARLTENNRIRIELKDESIKEIEAENIILAPGAYTRAIPEIEMDGIRIITHKEAIELESPPESILIVGGGSVGVEFSHIFNVFGSEVTIIEIMPQILPEQDPEIAISLKSRLERDGVHIFTESRIQGVSRFDNKIKVQLKTRGAEKSVNAEKVLLAAGRSPNTEGLGLEDVGIELERGFIKVYENFKTNIDNVYAVGDVVLSSPMYAHVAFEQGIRAAEAIAGLNPEQIDYNNIPHTIYTAMQVATIGMTKDQAIDKGFKVKESKRFFKSNPQAVIRQEDEGFIKVVADEETDRILGVHIFGWNACEVLVGFIIAKTNNLTFEDISRSIHAHPTLSEISQDISRAILGKEIYG